MSGNAGLPAFCTMIVWGNTLQNEWNFTYGSTAVQSNLIWNTPKHILNIIYEFREEDPRLRIMQKTKNSYGMGVLGRPMPTAEYKVTCEECYSLEECTVRSPKYWNIISTVYSYLFLSAIWGFRREADEIRALLGNYAANSGNYLPTFRNNLSVPSSRVIYIILISVTIFKKNVSYFTENSLHLKKD
jgi:hypothetical protein